MLFSPVVGPAHLQDLSCAGSGECHQPEARLKLKEILSSNVTPQLKTVRASLFRALAHRHTEVLAMGSTMSQSYEAALEVRRACLNVNLKVTSQHSRIGLFIWRVRLIAPPV